MNVNALKKMFDHYYCINRKFNNIFTQTYKKFGTVKPALSSRSKIDKTKILMVNGSKGCRMLP